MSLRCCNLTSFFVGRNNRFFLFFLPLADKSSDILDFCGNTSSNRAGAWSRPAFVQLFPITQQPQAFSKPPRTSPFAISGTTIIKNVIRFIRQCKSTPYLTVGHLVPVIHMQLIQATASVTSSPQPQMDRQRSTLHLRGETVKGRATLFCFT